MPCNLVRSTLTLILMAIATSPALADAAADAALRKCTTIADDDSRLTCFDALASVLVSDEVADASENSSPPAATAAIAVTAAGEAPEATAAATTAATAAPEAAAAPVETAAPLEAAATAGVAVATGAVSPLTDDVGKERVIAPSEAEQQKFSAKVTACRESVQSGQYYFTFDNGQVWKQSNYRQLNFRSCDFDVEIAKNAFGYEMYIPSKDRSVRIARIK
jgi:hypothetical protein